MATLMKNSGPPFSLKIAEYNEHSGVSWGHQQHFHLLFGLGLAPPPSLQAAINVSVWMGIV